MDKYAVIGWPVEHSVSPQMQSAGIKELGLNAVYEKIPVQPHELGEAVSRLRQEYAGWNITVPHKETILPHLDKVEEAAARIGSVNTVVNEAGSLKGYSTDGYGLSAALSESFGIHPLGTRFVFIGAGGAARATAAYFAANGAGKISIINRTRAKADAIAELIRELEPGCRTQVAQPDEKPLLQSLMQETDVIIQATSLGLKNDDPLPLDLGLAAAGTPVYDMIYRATPFLTEAQKHGCPTANGASMLLYQGARSLELWTGREAPVEAMRQALYASLGAARAKAS
ncbi:MAG: shikimate dehydrogenase [Lentisphaeria bacterium]